MLSGSTRLTAIRASVRPSRPFRPCAVCCLSTLPARTDDWPGRKHAPCQARLSANARVPLPTAPEPYTTVPKLQQFHTLATMPLQGVTMPHKRPGPGPDRHPCSPADRRFDHFCNLPVTPTLTILVRQGVSRMARCMLTVVIRLVNVSSP